MKHLMILLFIHANLFGQSTTDWRTKKNEAIYLTGVASEGHDVSFSTQLFKKKHQSIAIAGSYGTFYPSEKIIETASTTLELNTGSKHHFLSLGLHLTYATNQDQAFTHYFNQNNFAPSTLVGYQYSTSSIQLKVQVKPNLSNFQSTNQPLINSLKSFGSIASLTILLND